MDRALKHNIMQYVLDLSLHINGGSRCFHKMDSCVEDQNMQSEQCDPVSQLHSSFSSAVQTALYNAATIGRQLCVCVCVGDEPACLSGVQQLLLCYHGEASQKTCAVLKSAHTETGTL